MPSATQGGRVAGRGHGLVETAPGALVRLVGSEKVDGQLSALVHGGVGQIGEIFHGGVVDCGFGFGWLPLFHLSPIMLIKKLLDAELSVSYHSALSIGWILGSTSGPSWVPTLLGKRYINANAFGTFGLDPGRRS